MTNNYYEITQKKIPKKSMQKNTKILLNKKKTKGRKRSKKNIIIFLKNKIRSYVSI